MIGDSNAILGLLDVLHREQEVLNSATESIQKLTDSSSTLTAKAYDEKSEVLYNEEDAIDSVIRSIIATLSSIPVDVELILLKNIHDNGCQVCTQLIEELKGEGRL
jgi:hypothetical protein